MTRSTDTEVRTLIATLESEAEPAREAAIARLIIIGERAAARLVSAFDTTRSRLSQVAILRVLECSGDERALQVARRALAGGGDVAVAAVGVLRELLGRGTGATHTQALDLLLALATDASTEHRVRSTAFAVLQNGPQDIREALGPALAGPASSLDDATWDDAQEGRLPDDPEALRQVIATHAPTAPLPVLRRLVEAVRTKEQDAGSDVARWRGVRGTIHQAIALRGSRVALYDLRETFGQSAERLPSSFLAAMQLIGDESCLEPLAAAYARTSAQDGAWRAQLAQAFQTVAKRERITRKHAALRRAVAKAPDLLFQ